MSSIALQGLDQAEAGLTNSAVQLAGAMATPVAGANVDTVDLSAEVIAQMSAKNEFAANIATLKTSDEMQQATIDMMA